MEVKAPWLANYGDIPAHLAYFEGTMFELVEAVAQKYPKYIAFDFMGRSTTYAEFVSQVHACAKAAPLRDELPELAGLPRQIPHGPDEGRPVFCQRVCLEPGQH